MTTKYLSSKEIYFLVFSASTCILWHTSYKKHRGFCQEFINHPLSHKSLVFDVNQDAQNILNQKFRYLSCGRQAYVFESEDGKYVLKLLSSKRFLKNKNNSLLENELSSYVLAHQSLKEASGLVAMKLGPGPELPLLSLKDPWGLEKRCDLNQVDFILQKKAVTLAEFFKAQPLKIHDTLSKVHKLLEIRYQKNILDKDPRIHRNIGLTDEGPIFLDLGAFLHHDNVSSDTKKQELEKLVKYNQNYLKTCNLIECDDSQ